MKPRDAVPTSNHTLPSRTLLGAIGRALKALAAAVGLLVLLVAVPWALVRYIGWPLPTHLPTWDELSVWLTSPLTTDVFLKAIACVLWLAWANFVVDVAVEAVVEIRRIPAPRMPAGPSQALAAALVGAVLAGVLAAIARGAAPPSGPGPVHTHLAQTQAAAPTQQAASPVPLATEGPRDLRRNSAKTPATHPPESSYLVRRGDTLWGIADRELHDPYQWPRIYAANHHIVADPDLIYPGQRLTIPASAPPSAPDPNRDEPSREAPAESPQHDSERSGPDDGRTSTPSPTLSGTDQSSEPSAAPSTAAPSTAPPPSSPAQPEGTTEPRAVATGEDDGTAAEDPFGVRLPSGAWVAGSLAAAVLAAWGLALLHRRRRPPLPADHALELPADHALEADTAGAGSTPGLVSALDRLNGRWADRETPPDPRYGVPVLPLATGGPLAVTGEVRLAGHAVGGLGLSGPGAVSAIRAAIAGMVCAGGPLNPDEQGVVVTTDDMLTALLSDESAPQNGLRTGQGAGRLVVLSGADEVVRWLQVEIVRRRRLLDEHGAETADELRQVDEYAEPLPLVLTVLPTPQRKHGRLVRTVLAEAADLRMGGLLLMAQLPSDWPKGRTAFVDGDGWLTTQFSRPADESSAPNRVGTRMSTMSAADFRDALRVARAASGVPDKDEEHHDATRNAPAAPIEPACAGTPDAQTPDTGTPDARTTGTGALDTETPDTEPPGMDAPVGTGVAVTVDSLAHRSAAVDTAVVHRQGGGPSTRPGDGEAPAAHVGSRSAERPVLLTVFGKPKVIAGERELVKGLRSTARELLLWLALHPAGGTGAQIIADLWPERDNSGPEKRLVQTQLRTAIRNAREELGLASGRPHGWFITHVRETGRYLLNDEVENEWAVFESLLARADEAGGTSVNRAGDNGSMAVDSTAGDATARSAAGRAPAVGALDAAVGLCRGPLAEGYDSAWLVPLRRHTLDRVLDAYARLATLVEPDHPDQAAEYLRRAIEADPYAEPYYRALMRVHAAHGHHDEVRHTLQQLHTRLAELDTEPDQETIILAGQLLAHGHPAHDRPEPKSRIQAR